MLSYGVLGTAHTCVNEKSNCYLDYPVICLKGCGFYEKDKSIYSMKHFEINNISFDVGYGEKYAIDVTNEKIKIISDGKTAQIFIDGKKVRCTDVELHFIGHAKENPMITIDAQWHKTDENGNVILNEDKTAILTEGIKIDC